MSSIDPSSPQLLQTIIESLDIKHSEHQILLIIFHLYPSFTIPSKIKIQKMADIEKECNDRSGNGTDNDTNTDQDKNKRVMHIKEFMNIINKFRTNNNTNNGNGSVDDRPMYATWLYALDVIVLLNGPPLQDCLSEIKRLSLDIKYGYQYRTSTAGPNYFCFVKQYKMSEISDASLEIDSDSSESMIFIYIFYLYYNLSSHSYTISNIDMSLFHVFN